MGKELIQNDKLHCSALMVLLSLLYVHLMLRFKINIVIWVLLIQLICATNKTKFNLNNLFSTQ